MRGRGRTVACALAALALLGAIGAGQVQAAQGMSEGNVNVRLVGAQIGNSVFSLDGSKIECTTVEAETSGFVSSPASSLTVFQTYTGCTAFGFVNATVNTNGCAIVETLGSEVAADKFSGSVALECEAGKKITIVAATCEVQIGSQELSGEAFGTNNTGASPQDVVLDFDLSMAVTKTKDGFLCPLSGTGAGTGKYTGQTTGQGFNEAGEQVGVTFEP